MFPNTLYTWWKHFVQLFIAKSTNVYVQENAFYRITMKLDAHKNKLFHSIHCIMWIIYHKTLYTM